MEFALLLGHLWGDYMLQGDGMAAHKTRNTGACLYHVLWYSLPFLLMAFLGALSGWALLVILVTHFVIDRWRLAKYIAYVKYYWDWPFHEYRGAYSVEFVRDEEGNNTFNWLGDLVFVENPPFIGFMNPPAWTDCQETGYHKDKPAWMAVWLLILGDNILHLTINWLAWKYL